VHVRPDRGSRHAGIEQPKLPSHRLCQEWRDIGAEALDRLARQHDPRKPDSFLTLANRLGHSLWLAYEDVRIDYGIVLAGQVVLELDDGSETSLRVGDVVVQRGTNHAWANPSNEPARMVFVLVDGRFTDDLKAILPVERRLFDHALDE
jgi:Cupin domain